MNRLTLMIRTSARLCAFAMVALVACSDSATDPASDVVGGLRIIAGDDLTDTISVRPTQGLVAQVLDEDGKPQLGVEVRFEAPVESRILVSSVGGANFTTFASAVTDVAGRATARIQFSTRAGDGWVAVIVPLLALTDTARYQVRPGNAVRVQLAPRDTALSPGASFTIRGSTVDRANNPRQDPAEYSVAGTIVTVSNTGRVTARNETGIAVVRGRASAGASTVTDSLSVAVVPPGEIAWTTNSTVIIGQLNGSSTRTLTAGRAASWEPGGERARHQPQ